MVMENNIEIVNEFLSVYKDHDMVIESSTSGKYLSKELLKLNYKIPECPNIRQIAIYIIFLPETLVILFAIPVQLYATPMKNLYLTIFYASPVY